MQDAEWDWEHLETLGAGTDDVRGRYRHKPCGRVIAVLQGCCPICPKCQPEEWAATLVRPVRW